MMTQEHILLQMDQAQELNSLGDIMCSQMIENLKNPNLNTRMIHFENCLAKFNKVKTGFLSLMDETEEV